jgi:hypothetical protein
LKKEKLLGTGDERETIGPLWDTAKVEPTRRNAPARRKKTERLALAKKKKAAK